MSIPVSQFTPPFSPLGTIACFLHLWLYFCFVSKFICINFLDSTYKWYYMVFVFFCLIFHSMIISAAAAAKLLQSCPTLCDPIDGSPPGSAVPGFSMQEHGSGLPFPSPMHESEKWKGSRSVLSDSSQPHGLQPTRLLHPWDFPGKSTRVGCHRLLQYIH